MPLAVILAALAALAAVAYRLGSGRARALAGSGGPRLHSRPPFHGLYVALWTVLPPLVMIALWLSVEGDLVMRMTVAALPSELRALGPAQLGLVVSNIRNIAAGYGLAADPAIITAAAHYSGLRVASANGMALAALALAPAGLAYAQMRIRRDLRARNRVEAALRIFMVLCSTVAVFTTAGIVLSLVFESVRFFEQVPLHQFLFGLEWSPQMAIRADQVGATGSFGAVPLFAGTLLISGIAMLVAVPIGLLAAIYMAEYAPGRVRAAIKPALEILAGIPTVVYGFFAALVVGPLLRDAGASFGVAISSESALSAGLVMGIMIVPFVSSLSDDVITAVPQSLRDGSLALGATPSETIRRVVLPAALPGVVGGVLLAASRAIGETMIVVMAAGMSAKLSANPFEAVTTVTVQIVTLLVGDQEFDSPKTLAAFALGLVLFIVTLALNAVALVVVRKYREQYE